MSNTIEINLHELCAAGDVETLKQYFASEEFNPCELLKKNEEGFIPYHYALLYSHIECIEQLLMLEIDMKVNYQGLSPIHLALSPAAYKKNHSKVIPVIQKLVSADQDILACDRLGHTALHQVSCTGPAELIPLLIQAGIKPDQKDISGKMAIHLAIEYQQVECVKQILLEGGSDMFFCTDSRGDKPIHVAVRSASWECFNLILSYGSESMLSENNEFEQTPLEVAKNCGLYDEFQKAQNGDIVKRAKKTLIVTDEICTKHANFPSTITKKHDKIMHLLTQPENQRRLEVISEKPEGSLLVDEFQDLVWKNNIRPANIADILRVHEYSYVKKLKDFIEKLSHGGLPVRFDIDTKVNRESYDAALVAAGCVIEAVDSVVVGDFQNAFCSVRPPGHHVGPSGAVSSEEDPNLTSNGFCLFNNVALGAAYAKYVYSKDIQKIAIVDFDVHHGNGTEAIIKNLVPNKIPFDINLGIVSGALFYDSYKPWFSDTDAQNVLFISSHAYGSDSHGKFYPASGTYNSPESEYPGIINIPLSKPTDSLAFRTRNIYTDYRKTVFPRLLSFAPDIIFLSSGFDAHGLDTINSGFVDLDEDDYRWLSDELIKIANTCCKGRIVSVLEGGYSIQGGTISALGQSVAAHVRSLMRANYEHYFENSNQEDIDKMTMKNLLNDKFRELKRKRIKYARRVEEEFLSKFEEKIDPDDMDLDENIEKKEENSEDEEESEDEDSEGKSEEDEDIEDFEESGSATCDKELLKEEDLGNRTIE